MKTFFKIFLLFLIISLYQCKGDKKPPIEVTKNSPKKIKKPIVEKSWDSLNKNNVNAFFTEYGKQNTETKVLIKTSFGNIKLRLYEDVPIYRANFIFLTKIKYFNSTIFYRVAKNFVIQGGNSDKMYTANQRRKYGNYLLEPDFKKGRTHKYGALAAARQWDNNPNKLSSPFEFYIVQRRSGAHHLDNEHTVFGEVISGFETIDKIAKVKVDYSEWPIDDIKMTVEILN